MTNWETTAQTRFLISFSFETKKCISAVSVLLMSVLEPMNPGEAVLEPMNPGEGRKMKKKYQYRKVFGEYPLTEFKPILTAGLQVGHVNLEGQNVNCGSVRLRLFASTDCTCVRCGKVATTFILESLDPKAGRPHLNLYGKRQDGSLLLFTKDHILPRALSGSDRLVNMQVMCRDCNFKKDFKLQVRDVPKILGQVIRGDASLFRILLALGRAGRKNERRNR